MNFKLHAITKTGGKYSALIAIKDEITGYYKKHAEESAFTYDDLNRLVFNKYGLFLPKQEKLRICRKIKDKKSTLYLV